ncbi:hypothetical protein G9A89_003547 [Geosiphon pyriformis]|nr:hypothetical protein G9A89_003547 [Geosiphon pyriformis]
MNSNDLIFNIPFFSRAPSTSVGLFQRSKGQQARSDYITSPWFRFFGDRKLKDASAINIAPDNDIS